MKKIYYIIFAIIAIIIIVFAARFFLGGSEDTWICQNGEWVKHGNPSAPKPTTGCEKETTGIETKYNWSTMSEGPYQDKISYATSNDLLNWTDSKKILVEHASVPGAVYKDGIIYVYFVDVSENGKPEQIGLIRSSDNGKNWSQKTIVTFEGIGDKVPVDPAPFLLPDGRLRLYYFDISVRDNPSFPNKIYSAISQDGLRFVQEEGIRFVKQGIFDPDVIKVGDTWRLYVGDVEKNLVFSATSQDGLNFNEEGLAYQAGAVPDVFYENNKFYLYTAGINIITSNDGTHFGPPTGSFHSGLGPVTADPSVVKLNDGTYMMFYKTKQ